MTKIASEAYNKAQDPMAWFKHDANASQDFRLRRLALKYGNHAKGTFWNLCEILASTKHHALSIETEEDWIVLASALEMYLPGTFDEVQSVAECRDFIMYLLEIGLLVRDGKGRIENENMTDNALYFGKQRVNGAKGGRPRKNRPEAAN